ncbi:MAG TPA: hypothetical protein VFQ90_00210 [Stellaceae bacterium]|jgi:hypothetical protein|nr:hypothetical protein [Stellaceae bacterium]
MTGAPDYITVVTTFGPMATKIITANPSGAPIIKNWDRIKRVRMRKVWISSLADAVPALSNMGPRQFIVRGKPIDGEYWQDTVRRLKPRKKADGTVEPATLEAAAHHLVVLDFDSVECPDWLDDPQHDPDACVEHLVSLLPEEFHGASCWWAFTGSMLIKPGLRMRLAFWSDRPLSDDELKAWLADAPVDHAIFHPIQAIYIAAPVFVGMPDLCPHRCGVWPGDRDAITPPAVIEPAKRQRAPRQPSDDVYTAHGEAVGAGGGDYDSYKAEIGDHAEGDGFNAPLRRAVGAWLRINGSKADPAWLRADLEQAIRNAPRDPALHDDAYIEFRCGSDLDSLIERVAEWQADSEAEAQRLADELLAAYGAKVESDGRPAISGANHAPVKLEELGSVRDPVLPGPYPTQQRPRAPAASTAKREPRLHRHRQTLQRIQRPPQGTQGPMQSLVPFGPLHPVQA